VSGFFFVEYITGIYHIVPNRWPVENLL